MLHEKLNVLDYYQKLQSTYLIPIIFVDGNFAYYTNFVFYFHEFFSKFYICTYQGPGNDFYLGGALVIRKMKFSQF